MITGSSTAAIISAGVLVCPILVEMGIPKVKAGAFIALGGMFGATAPAGQHGGHGHRQRHRHPLLGL